VPDFNTIPWTTDELIDFACLVAGTIMVCAFPVVYAFRARLRDRLALVMLFATGATAVAFVLTVFFTLYFHAGHTVDEEFGHWIARGLYLTVGAGKLLLLWTLLQALRRPPGDAAR